jgi:hypothetical protein
MVNQSSLPNFPPRRAQYLRPALEIAQQGVCIDGDAHRMMRFLTIIISMEHGNGYAQVHVTTFRLGLSLFLRPFRDLLGNGQYGQGSWYRLEHV